jgi:hypothetical protein
MIQSKRVWWVGHVEHVEKKDIYIGLGCGNLKRRKVWKTVLWMGDTTKMNFTGIGLEVED